MQLLHSLGHALMTAWQRRRVEMLHADGALEDFFDATDNQLLRLWSQAHDKGTYSSMRVLIGFFSAGDKDSASATDEALCGALDAMARAADKDATTSRDLSFAEFLACAHVVKM